MSLVLAEVGRGSGGSGEGSGGRGSGHAGKRHPGLSVSYREDLRCIEDCLQELSLQQVLTV